MAGQRLRCHHLVALRDVLDAASSEAGGLAVPWAALERLRTLLGSDLVAFEGVDHDRDRRYFSQSAALHHRSFSAAGDPMVATASDRPVSRGSPPPGGAAHHPHPTGSALAAGVPDGHGRELRLLSVRERPPEHGDRERLVLRLVLPHLEAAYRRGEEHRATEAVTARQAMLMELVRDGYTNAQIAHRLELAEGTVRTHLNNIYARLAVQSRTEAVNRLYGSRGSTSGATP